jgi:hypothetical protein
MISGSPLRSKSFYFISRQDGVDLCMLTDDQRQIDIDRFQNRDDLRKRCSSVVVIFALVEADGAITGRAGHGDQCRATGAAATARTGPGYADWIARVAADGRYREERIDAGEGREWIRGNDGDRLGSLLGSHSLRDGQCRRVRSVASLVQCYGAVPDPTRHGDQCRVITAAAAGTGRGNGHRVAGRPAGGCYREGRVVNRAGWEWIRRGDGDRLARQEQLEFIGSAVIIEACADASVGSGGIVHTRAAFDIDRLFAWCTRVGAVDCRRAGLDMVVAGIDGDVVGRGYGSGLDWGGCFEERVGLQAVHILAIRSLERKQGGIGCGAPYILNQMGCTAAVDQVIVEGRRGWAGGGGGVDADVARLVAGVGSAANHL